MKNIFLIAAAMVISGKAAGYLMQYGVRPGLHTAPAVNEIGAIIGVFVFIPLAVTLLISVLKYMERS